MTLNPASCPFRRFVIMTRCMACWMACTLCVAFAVAAEPLEIPLWPEGVPEPRVPSEPAEKSEKGKDGISRRTNVSNPRLVVHLAKDKGADSSPRPAVVVIPGGGYGILADEHEGSDVCRWLNEHGCHAFVLLHRVPTNRMPAPNVGPVMDAQRAVATVRSRAAEFGVDPKRIGLLGFSAGGHTALVASMSPPAAGVAEAAAARPDCVLLIYPWKVLGDDGRSVRSEVTIDADTPPVFIAQCGDDKASPPQGAAALYLALVEAKVPAEIHVYEKGGHGYGLKAGNTLPGTLDWKLRAIDWLRSHGF